MSRGRGWRTYLLEEVCAFQGLGQEWEEYLNWWMMPVPMRVNGIMFTTTGALYHAMKFPYDPALQEQIAAAANPEFAVRLVRRKAPLKDWREHRLNAMRVAIRMKMACNERRFRKSLSGTGNRDIVGVAMRDDFWGARPAEPGYVRGENVLGRLWMEAREEARATQSVPDYRKWKQGLYIGSRIVEMERDGE